MEKNREELLNGSIFKLFLKYFIPTLIGSIVVVLYNIVDRFFVGKVSEQALAGAGVAFYIIMLLIAFAMLVGVGSGTIISLRLGKGRDDEAEKILGNAVSIFLILGLFLYVILKLNMNTILLYSGANTETLPYAKVYLEIILYAIFPLFFSYGMTNVLNAAGTPRLAMFSLMVGAVTNIILDYVAVMILHMGIKGTAYATLIGNVLGAIIVMFFLITGKMPLKVNLLGYKLEHTSLIRLRLKNMILEKNIVKDIVSIGMSPFLLQAASSAVGLVTNKIVEINGGTYGVAIVTIINSYLPIMTMTVYSVSQAIQPIIGFNYGGEIYNRVKKSLYVAVFMGVLLSSIFWVVVMIFPKEMVQFFNEKGTEVSIQKGVKALVVYFSLIVPASLGIIIPNYFQATGRARYAVVLNLLRQVVIFLLVMIIFSKIWGLDGVWYAQPFTDGLFFVVLLGFFYFEIKGLNEKIKNKKIEVKEGN